MPRTTGTTTLAGLTAQDVDTIVAALLDTADRDETEAREQGRPRLAASSIRQLRHYARTLADFGTPNALADAPTEQAPAELRFAHQDAS